MRDILSRLIKLELTRQSEPEPSPRIVCIQHGVGSNLWNCSPPIGQTQNPPEGSVLIGVRDCRDPSVIEAERAANSPTA